MLLRTLLQLSLALPEKVIPECSIQTLCSATDQQWEDAIADLKMHRLVPLVFQAFNEKKLHQYVPKACIETLMTGYFQSRRRNVLMFNSLSTVLEECYAVGVHPVFWKGVVLADQFYPELGTRIIGDADWSVSPQELATIQPVLEKLGFTLQPGMETPDAVYFKNADRVFLDVHHRVRLFEGKEHLSLTEDIPARLSLLPGLRVLEPNAMLTHLTVHLNGHANEIGFQLFWIIDFVFLLRKWGDRIDLEQLKLLIPDQQSWRLLGRVLRFLQVEFSEPLPPALAEFAARSKPLTLEGILYQSKLALFELHQPKGWLKLLACKAGLSSDHPYQYPEASTLWDWATAMLLPSKEPKVL